MNRTLHLLCALVLGSCDNGSPASPDLSMPDLQPPADLSCAFPLCNGRCVDLQRDPTNCGVCGHTCGCGSTSCTNGSCDAVKVASNQGGPYMLTLDSGNLYWGNDSDTGLFTMPAGGGTPTRLFPNRTAVRGIAVSGNDIYFSRFLFNIIEHGTITGGGGGNYTNTREAEAWGIAVDATNVYWADDSNTPSLVRTAALANPLVVTTLFSATGHYTALAIDAVNIYWLVSDAAPQGAVMRGSKGGSNAVPLASGQALPADLTIDGTYAYWTNSGDGTVNRVPLAGGAVTPLVAGRKDPRGLRVDASFVYYADFGAGTVEKVALGGGTPVVLAANLSQPLSVTVDNSCVYFTEYANGAVAVGSIRKASKQ